MAGKHNPEEVKFRWALVVMAVIFGLVVLTIILAFLGWEYVMYAAFFYAALALLPLCVTR